MVRQPNAVQYSSGRSAQMWDEDPFAAIESRERRAKEESHTDMLLAERAEQERRWEDAAVAYESAAETRAMVMGDWQHPLAIQLREKAQWCKVQIAKLLGSGR